MESLEMNDQLKAQLKKTCPKKHELIQSTSISLARAAELSKKFNGLDHVHIFCDICRSTIFFPKNRVSKEEFYSCDECRFDSCKECYSSFN